MVMVTVAVTVTVTVMVAVTVRVTVTVTITVRVAVRVAVRVTVRVKPSSSQRYLLLHHPRHLRAPIDRPEYLSPPVLPSHDAPHAVHPHIGAPGADLGADQDVQGCALYPERRLTVSPAENEKEKEEEGNWVGNPTSRTSPPRGLLVGPVEPVVGVEHV